MMRTLYFVICLLIAIPALANRDSPNVLFIVSDDLNHSLGTYGHPLVKTPNIDSLARRGVRFDAAYTQMPGCNPSRTSFLSGLYPEQNGMTQNGSQHFQDIAPSLMTMPHYFRNNGYFTSRVGKIFHYGVPSQIGTNGNDDPAAWDVVSNPMGIDKKVEKQVHTIFPKGKEPKVMRLGEGLSWLSVPSEDAEHTDGKVAREAVRILTENHPDKTGKPFFMGVGFFRPHTPYIAPQKYFDLYPLDKIETFKNPPNDRDDIPEPALADGNLDYPYQLSMSEETQKKVLQAYYASVSFVDAQLGFVLKALQELNLDKNTIIVFMSDHGYQLGHHNLWQKGDLFEGSSRTPLIVYDPRAKANGSATKSLVELIDIYPTLTALTGLETPDILSGKSFAPILDDPNVRIRSAAYTQGMSRSPAIGKAKRRVMGYSIRTERYRYTLWGDGQYGEELYDYQADPGEFTNRADSYPYISVRVKLRYLLDERKADATRKKPGVELNYQDIGSPLGFK